MPTNLPDVWCGVCFTADPNDPNATVTWSDLSTRTLAIQSAKRGRQYELDQNQTGQALVYWRNQDEALNPANTSSPYAPNVVPLRRVQVMAMYPAAGTGNLLPAQGIDPSFESYTAGASLSWVKTVGTGVNPTVTTTNPQQGTKCLTYATTAGTGENGIGWTVRCIPGRQYTTSVYVRQTAANTVEVFINAGATGSSTTTTGAYVRLSVTWTASQSTHDVWVASFSTSLTGTVYVDAIQHEPGGTVSAFTTSGPIIRPVWGGYVERFPTSWEPDSRGFEGAVLAPCVGPFAALAGQKMSTEYRNALLAKAPDYYWPLSEPAGATQFADTSGKSGPSLTPMDGKYGAGTVTAGTAMNIAGDPDATGVTIDNGDGNTKAINVPLTVLQYGVLEATNVGITAAAAGAQSWSCTMALWMTHSTLPTANLFLMAFYDAVNGNTPLSMANSNTLGLYFGSGTVASASVADSWADGKPHLFVATQTMTSTGASQTVWVDGTQVANVSSAGDYRPKIPQVLKVMVGGFLNENTVETGVPATWADLAYWNRALSSAEVTDLWNAGQGYSGETSGARVSRFLGYGWTGASSIDTGMTRLGPSTVTDSQSLLTAVQAVTVSENGNLYEGPDGSLVFSARTHRYLATTSAYTFGEGAGEYPYEADVTFDFDPTLVYNDVTVQRVGGITAHVEDAASQKRYFPRSLPEGVRQTGTASDNETTDYANYLLNEHKQPRLRVRQVTFNPAANPALWAMLLSLDIGTRVTVKRRPKAANGGAGITMSGDYFVENIEHHGIDFGRGTWLVTLLLSPVDYTSVWIVGDSTYGVLDSTTVLAF